TCMAISPAGAVVARALLEVPAPILKPPPIISVQPRNLTVVTGSVTILLCRGEGDPRPRVSWARKGQPLPGPDPRITLLGSSTLQIDSVRVSDGGIYSCTATSATGSTTVNCTLTVVLAGSPEAELIPPVADPRDLPGPPRPPTMQARNATSITLIWQPPEKEGASPIINYVVELWSGSKSWRILDEKIVSNNFIIGDLRPETQHRAVVRAINKHGISAASVISEPLVTGRGEGGD
ncbi:unnamed protein product, partial [Meganyctiphanes norvegica]